MKKWSAGKCFCGQKKTYYRGPCRLRFLEDSESQISTKDTLNDRGGWRDGETPDSPHSLVGNINHETFGRQIHFHRPSRHISLVLFVISKKIAS